jgi:hypothetical protein
MTTPPDSPVRTRRSSSVASAIGAYALPVLIMVAAVAAYLVPRPVTEWFGMNPTPPQVPDDMDNIIRLLAVPIAFLGLVLLAVVAVVRSVKMRRTQAAAAPAA